MPHGFTFTFPHSKQAVQLGIGEAPQLVQASALESCTHPHELQLVGVQVRLKPQLPQVSSLSPSQHAVHAGHSSLIHGILHSYAGIVGMLQTALSPCSQLIFEKSGNVNTSRNK